MNFIGYQASPDSENQVNNNQRTQRSATQQIIKRNLTSMVEDSVDQVINQIFDEEKLQITQNEIKNFKDVNWRQRRLSFVNGDIENIPQENDF